MSEVVPKHRDPASHLAPRALRRERRRGLALVRRKEMRIYRPGYDRLKRTLDVVGALLLLPGALAVIAVCAVFIIGDNPGPVFFVQERTGRGGRRFRMLKLRTMVADAHERKAEYVHLNHLSGPDFKILDDPRVTRVGRFLRKSSLDEVPQLLNVLWGDMSLVGPRPTSFAADTYGLWHTERLEVLPGITGLWQISGRSEVDFDERVRLDIEYVQRRGLGLDLLILCRTVTAVLQNRGAY
jgi:lipopolysaccharide/colanic/teichoic acid biosynthesis glycosyltransferase